MCWRSMNLSGERLDRHMDGGQVGMAASPEPQINLTIDETDARGLVARTSGKWSGWMSPQPGYLHTTCRNFLANLESSHG
jgi:hypothetical protein